MVNFGTFGRAEINSLELQIWQIESLFIPIQFQTSHKSVSKKVEKVTHPTVSPIRRPETKFIQENFFQISGIEEGEKVIDAYTERLVNQT